MTIYRRKTLGYANSCGARPRPESRSRSCCSPGGGCTERCTSSWTPEPDTTGSSSLRTMPPVYRGERLIQVFWTPKVGQLCIEKRDHPQLAGVHALIAIVLPESYSLSIAEFASSTFVQDAWWFCFGARLVARLAS